jgi:hypothetical protein
MKYNVISIHYYSYIIVFYVRYLFIPNRYLKRSAHTVMVTYKKCSIQNKIH